MSNSKIDQYKETYSNLISKVAELHNRNIEYSNNWSFVAKKDVRRLLKELRLLTIEAWRLSNEAFKENKKIKKEVPINYKIDPITGKKRYRYPKKKPKSSL